MDFDALIGPSYITDIPRIISVFSNLDDVPKTVNTRLKRKLSELRNFLISTNENKKADPFNVFVYSCAQAKGFTQAAENEFERLNYSTINYHDVNIKFTIQPVFLPDLIDAKWKETNTKWITNKNIKKERFTFDVCGSLIRDSSKSFIFLPRQIK